MLKFRAVRHKALPLDAPTRRLLAAELAQATVTDVAVRLGMTRPTIYRAIQGRTVAHSTARLLRLQLPVERAA